MPLVFPGNFADRFQTDQGFQSNFGLEGTTVPFAFSSAHTSAVVPFPAEPEKSDLTHCPEFGGYASLNHT
jgi:hypothetical protein